MRRGLVIVCALAATAAVLPARAAAEPVEVVVALEAPPLASAVARSRALSASARQARLNLRSPTSAAYIRSLAAAQRSLERRIARAIPSAAVRWRYRIVLNGLAVVVPQTRVDDLRRFPGVSRVYRSVTYRSRLDRSPRGIGAVALWGPSFSTAGSGLKIGIVDDGVDQRHPFFNPAGFTAPAGFPKGQSPFATPKVIVARAFPPPRPRYARAGQPFDNVHSVHATHVAGIAAGDRTVGPGGRQFSGVAPAAYIGNYKVLTIPTASGVGLDGNSPEIAAGIEAAVRDGMDVVNLSLGEPEIEPSNDLVTRAIDAAAEAGVVPTVAAGNDYAAFGRGSLASPGSAARAITAAASTRQGEVADFSSSGPTPLSLRMKPDVTAPGVGIVSSVPSSSGTWAAFSGTSMAAPHVAGAAALLRQRHPTWTVAQIKSALVLTGDPVSSDEADGEAPTTRIGGGLVNLVRADNPLVFAEPSGLSFGLLRPGAAASREIVLSDAGGGAGSWTVSTDLQGSEANISAPPTVPVPGLLTVSASGSAEGEVTGFVVLSRGDERRRIPFWLRVAEPRLGGPQGTLTRTGTYAGNTRGRPALVERYRYPDNPRAAGIITLLSGPEQVFRVTLARSVANFGVRLVSEQRGAGIEARVVSAGDENRLVGYTSFPLNLNPYLPTFLRPVRAAGAVLPAAGSYDVVFDSASPAAGAFRFRFWISDTGPPSARLLTRTLRRGRPLRLRVTDTGSGVWPRSLIAIVDDLPRRATYSARSSTVTIPVGALRAGRHRLVFQVSDYQETRNMENVPRILPNTRRIAVTFRVR